MPYPTRPKSLRACQLYHQVRLILEFQPEAVSDRTIQRWRWQAFVKRKPFYTLDDAQQIADYAVLLIKLGSVQAAREQFAEILDEKQEEKDAVTQYIDVKVEPVA
jgi:hypothetical protein